MLNYPSLPYNIFRFMINFYILYFIQNVVVSEVKSKVVSVLN
jgi:hypothetical protein